MKLNSQILVALTFVIVTASLCPSLVHADESCVPLNPDPAKVSNSGIQLLDPANYWAEIFNSAQTAVSEEQNLTAYGRCYMAPKSVEDSDVVHIGSEVIVVKVGQRMMLVDAPVEALNADHETCLSQLKTYAEQVRQAVVDGGVGHGHSLKFDFQGQQYYAQANFSTSNNAGFVGAAIYEARAVPGILIIRNQVSHTYNPDTLHQNLDRDIYCVFHQDK